MKRPTGRDTSVAGPALPPSAPAVPSDPREDAGSGSMVRKALELVDCFGEGSGELSMRELGRRAGIPRSTAHRLVGELVDWGALERTPGGLRLGVKLFELGTLVRVSSTVREAAAPYARHLSEVTRLTVNVAVLEGVDVVYLDKIAARDLRIPDSRQGGRGEAHATALGKAILAFSDPAVQEQVLARPLKALTPRTITEAAQLRAELARVHADRLAYDREEWRSGIFCVGSPILDARNQAIAAVSVTGATALSQAEHFAPAVLTTAMAIARSLSRDGITRHRH